MNKAIVHIKYWLLLMLLVVGNSVISFAADDDEGTDEVAVRLLEQTIQKNLSLESAIKSLNRQIKNWNDTIKDLEKDMLNAQKQMKKQQQQLEKIRPAKSQDEEAALVQRQQSLQNELARIEEENARLQREIKDLNLSWGETSHDLEELEKIKQGVAAEFVNENEPYLEQPFTTMAMSKLQQLQGKCADYQGDHKVDAFSNKLEDVIRHKVVFDEANAVVHQPFDRNAIKNAQRSLSQINNLCAPQAEEVKLLQQQLAAFERGLQAFKAYIDDFDSRRETITSPKYVKTEVSFVEENMGDRINNEIKAIPYLKTMFEKYRKAIFANPQNKSAEEKAILEQYNNNIKL